MITRVPLRRPLTRCMSLLLKERVLSWSMQEREGMLGEDQLAMISALTVVVMGIGMFDGGLLMVYRAN